MIIWFRNSKMNVVDQHCQLVRLLPKVIWPTAFLVKKIMLFTWHFWLASQCPTSKFEQMLGNALIKNTSFAWSVWIMFMNFTLQVLSRFVLRQQELLNERFCFSLTWLSSKTFSHKIEKHFVQFNSARQWHGSYVINQQKFTLEK